MCRKASSPLGIPLSPEILGEMNEEERSFWLNFLREIQDLQDQPDEMLVLPEALLEKYNTAVQSYDGLQYCQMIQIKILYSL